MEPMILEIYTRFNFSKITAMRHFLLTFHSCSQEIAWIEFKQDKEEDPVTKFNKYRDGRRTCWKTHLPLPLCNTEVGAKYVIVGRDSRDSVVSWIHFLRKYNPGKLGTVDVFVHFNLFNFYF